MSEYPEDLKRMRILVDMGGRERWAEVDVPAEWPRWADDTRRAWAREACVAAVSAHVFVSWSDRDWAGHDMDWPDSWNGYTGELIA